MGYDFDLCCNEQCPKRFDCQRYMTYKNGEWEHCYVMRGCIDYQLLKQVTNETEEMANRVDGASVKTDCELR